MHPIIDILSSEMTEAKKQKVGKGLTISYRAFVLIALWVIGYWQWEANAFRDRVGQTLSDIRTAQMIDSTKHAIEAFDHQRYESHFARLDNGDIVMKSEISMIKGKLGMQ